ncbi:MAG: universal stress protein, partial [Mycobacterium sp.]
MTVVAGYLAGKAGRSALHLAVEAAKTLNTSLVVVTVVPKPWTTPSPARIDAEYAAWADQLAADSQREAQRCLDQIGQGVEISFKKVANRTAGEGLLEAAEELEARVLVTGSSSNGALGQVVLGSTTDWLLHSAPVPVALSPRGYRGARS